MDWRSIKFDWNQVRAFLVTAEEGSLSAAARALGVAQPTLGRQVAALETQLRVALFRRSGRGLELTATGTALLGHVRAMGEAAGALSLAAAGHTERVEGLVRVSASEAMAAFVLPPLMRNLRQLHPGIEIEIVVSASISGLKRDEADIALRFYYQPPMEADLIGRKLRAIQGHLYASNDYMARFGKKRTPEMLADADFVGPRNNAAFIALLHERKLPVTPANFTTSVTNSIVTWQLVKQGLGIGVLTENLAGREPGLQRVLPDFPPIAGELWLLAHHELKTSRRIRTVYDFLFHEMAEPALR